MIAVASPDEEYYKDFIKELTPFYLPTWKESELRLFAEDVPGFYRNSLLKRCVELSTDQFALLTCFTDTGSVQEV